MQIPEILKNKIFTVSEFNEFVNDVMRPLEVWIEGEVSDWRISQNKFVWFSLKDAGQTVSCFSMVFRIRQPVEEGMKVRVFGYPKIYGKSGRFSFMVEWLELTGEGSLKRAFELLHAKLEKEGLFAAERKRPLPRFPQTIGLITSRDAAAFSDFMKVINARLGGLEIKFIPAAVQGVNAIPEIVSAFDYFNRYPPDVVVLTRGGGSLEDLKEFNSEEIARAVFSSRAPVVTGIGHERDIALAELSADFRASTPTAAAIAIVPDRQDLFTSLSSHATAWKEALDRQFSIQRHRLMLLTGNLSDTISMRAFQIRSLLEQFSFSFSRLADQIQMQKNGLLAQSRLLTSLAPQNVLKRGYSITRKNGKIVTTAEEVSVGDELAISLSKGGLNTKVEEVINPKSK